ncbi:MAG: hypothetical protein BWK80_24695 [Desulfobacteraceae bacterium IS3]|nr:MAG: hypothetical protein BWK80_24695 [Desulfobacteraceae bacterium IS3]
MIRFSNPKKEKTASETESLELTEAGSWLSFPPFAEKYVKQIGAKIKRKIEAPYMHLWEIEYEGAVLNFVYDDFPNGISIEPKDKSGQDAVEKLYKLALSQSDPNGL